VLRPRERRNFLILLVMMLLAALFETVGVAAVPVFVSAIINPAKLRSAALLGHALAPLADLGPDRLVVLGSLVMLGIFAFKSGFLIFNQYLQGRYVDALRVSLSQRLMRAYMRAPYAFHLARNSSELLRNMNNEIITVCNDVLVAILELGTRMLILCAVLAFLFAVEPVITAGWVVFLGGLGGGAVIMLSGQMRRMGRKAMVERGEFLQSLNQAFGSVKEARVLGRTRFFERRVDRAVRELARIDRHKQFIAKIVPPLSEFVAITGILVLATALVFIGRNTDSILVTLSLFIVGLVRLKEVAGAAITHFSHLRHSLVSVEPLHHDLQMLAGQTSASTRGARTIVPRERITLKNVTFTYSGLDEPALRAIEVDIPVGSAVAFVGSTGAGKSTLVDVLLGLLEPEQGAVMVDGTDIRTIGAIGRWQSAIGYVPQSIYLLDDTIRRNIALGVEDEAIDEPALREAIRVAQLESFIARQPQGLDTPVGERGVRLSGGERQRIGIARALYHDPSIIVFDEATSALDNTTERAVIEAVEQLRGRRTIIMIAHRLTTVKDCDRLYYLKQGAIEAEGDFEMLTNSHDEFRRMARA